MASRFLFLWTVTPRMMSVWPEHSWQFQVATSNTFRCSLLVATARWESLGPRNCTSNTWSVLPQNWKDDGTCTCRTPFIIFFQLKLQYMHMQVLFNYQSVQSWRKKILRRFSYMYVIRVLSDMYYCGIQWFYCVTYNVHVVSNKHRWFLQV